MKRLLLWNLLLAVCATAGIYELRREWLESRQQQEVVLLHKPPAPKVNVSAPPVKPAPFQATNYGEVAQKTLFSKDRNPNIEIVAPPAPPPPPPPPPMPALPKVYGVLGLPSGAVALMADKSGAAQKKVRVGDSIGEFKIAKLDMQRITLTWMDKTVDKSVDELLDRTVAVAPAPAPAQAAAVAAAPAPAPTGPPQLGIEVGGDGHSVRTCKPDDASPAGTLVAGYKKTYENTPFGQACHWVENK